MKVTLQTTLAGPKGSHQAGAVLETGVHITEEHAQELIEGGFAFDQSVRDQEDHDRREAARAQKREASEGAQNPKAKKKKASETGAKTQPETR